MVWGKVEHLLSRPEVILTELERQQRKGTHKAHHEAELERVEAQLRHVEKAKDRVWKAHELTGDEQKFKQEIAAVVKRTEGLSRRMLDLQTQIEASQQAEVNWHTAMRFCELARSNLASFTFENKRMALEALGIKVWLDGKSVIIEGAIPEVDSSVVSAIPPSTDS